VEQVDACTFVIATRQLRVHFCTKSFFYLNAMSEPIIEDTTGAQFAPYNLRYALLEQQMEAAGFVKTKLNRWNEVKDFHWHKNTHSPNWSVLQEDQRTVTFQGDEAV
jgi:hypothetical protein